MLPKIKIANPQTLEELKANIRREIGCISEFELIHINAHFIKKMPVMCG